MDSTKERKVSEQLSSTSIQVLHNRKARDERPLGVAPTKPKLQFNKYKTKDFREAQPPPKSQQMAKKAPPTPEVVPRNPLKPTFSNKTQASQKPSKKLLVRGLSKFVTSRGNGSPPTWVKNFPCKSKYAPDNYIVDGNDGPLETTKMTHKGLSPRLKGGRCSVCGTFSGDVCINCRKCKLDCKCQTGSKNKMREMDPIPGFLSQAFGPAWNHTQKFLVNGELDELLTKRTEENLRRNTQESKSSPFNLDSLKPPNQGMNSMNNYGYPISPFPMYAPMIQPSPPPIVIMQSPTPVFGMNPSLMPMPTVSSPFFYPPMSPNTMFTGAGDQ